MSDKWIRNHHHHHHLALASQCNGKSTIAHIKRKHLDDPPPHRSASAFPRFATRAVKRVARLAHDRFQMFSSLAAITATLVSLPAMDLDAWRGCCSRRATIGGLVTCMQVISLVLGSASASQQRARPVTKACPRGGPVQRQWVVGLVFPSRRPRP